MHEAAVTESIMKIVLDHARQAGAKRVVKVNLVVGELAGYVNESVRFYFDLLAEGTEAEKAVLEIERVPARVRCSACRKEFAPEPMSWLCPLCGGVFGEVLAGRECYVDSLEAE
jgi:hydrogenase nickel incorporation protein HypA/HybF